VRTQLVPSLWPSRTPPTPPAVAAGLQKLLHGDAAPGLSVTSGSQRAQLNALDDGVQRAMDAGKAAQAAQIGVQGLTYALQEARVAAEFAADKPSLAAEDRRALQVRLGSALEALDRVARHTGYGEMKLLDGSLGADSAEGGLTYRPLDESRREFRLTVEDLSSKGLGLEGLDLSTAEGAKKAVEAIARATDRVQSHASSLERFRGNVEEMLRAVQSVRSGTVTPGSSLQEDYGAALRQTPTIDSGLALAAARASTETLIRLLG